MQKPSPLRLTRLIRGLTQIQLSLHTGITPDKISLYEHGYVEPNQDRKKKLASALNVSVDHIFPNGKKSDG